MKILVLGDGLLGAEIINQSGWGFISRKKNGFDINDDTQFEKYFLCYDDIGSKIRKYDVLINCIAHTDTYSKDKNLHWKTNYESIVNLTDFCNQWKIKLVHISTDYVYTNSIKEASENDIPIHGNNWYSYTKLLGDSYIELKSNNYLICRGSHKPNPFPYENAWVDHIGNFDYTDKISSIIINLVKNGCEGIYNIGTNLKSIYDLGLETKKVNPIFKPNYVPENVSMNLDKLNNFNKKIDEERIGNISI